MDYTPSQDPNRLTMRLAARTVEGSEIMVDTSRRFDHGGLSNDVFYVHVVSMIFYIFCYPAW